MKRNAVIVLLLLAACARQESEVVDLPDDTRDGVLYTLASLFQLDYEQIELTRTEARSWQDDCFGIAMRGPCTEGDVPGYRFFVTLDGQDYEYRSSKANPLNLLLAASPDPVIDDPRLTWEDEVPMFASEGEPGRCVNLLISANGSASVGYCDAPQLTRPLLEPLDRPSQWTYFFERFAPFTYETGRQKLLFQGQGTEIASPAWKRAILSWAEVVHAEQASGRSAASWGTAFAWRRATPDQPDYCDFMTIQRYALAQAGRGPCEGGNDAEPFFDDLLGGNVWTTFDRWNTTYAVRDTGNVHFFGSGDAQMPSDTVTALDRWAQNLFEGWAEKP